MKKQINIQFISLSALIIVAGIWRIISYPEGCSPLTNFTPIGAMALFGGAYFKEKYKAFLFPLLTLLASDILIMKIYHPDLSSGLLYNGWLWTYISFLLIVILGFSLKKITPISFCLVSVAGAFIHWLVTNFGVWLSGCTDITTNSLYSSDFSGLLKCYMLSIPYMSFFALGNLFYGIILFGGYKIINSTLSPYKSTI